MAEQGEAGAAVHLSFDHFRARIHALGSAVVVRLGERGDDGVLVLLESVGEGVHVRQVGRPGRAARRQMRPVLIGSAWF